MRERIHAFVDAEDATTATTKPIDIKSKKPMSTISIEFKALNNGNNPTAHPAAMLTNIEVVDGSKELFSLSGYHSNAINCIDNLDNRYRELNYCDECRSIAMINLDFGRYPGDPVYAFDPAQFDNPQIRITHNLASGGSSPDAATLSVFGHFMEDPSVVPTHYLRKREVKEHTLTSSAEFGTPMPTDHPIRRFFIRSLYDNLQPFEQYNKVKVDINDGSYVPINNLRTSDLLKFLPYNPYMNEFLRGYITATTSDEYFVTPTYDTKVIPQYLGNAGDYLYPGESYGGTVDLYGVATDDFDCVISGKAPHGLLNFQQGNPMKPETWLQLEKKDSLDVTVTSGSAVGSSSKMYLLVEQAIKY